MSEQDRQIAELNSTVKVTLAPSKIHGIGVFAIRDISKGEVLYCDRMPKIYKVPWGSMSKLFPEVRELIVERWPSIINRSVFISPDARYLSFMNHSEENNYDPLTDTATRDIPVGSEVLEDYRMMENWSKVYPFLK